MTIKDRITLGKIRVLEEVLIATGRWTKDSDVGLIQLSGYVMDRIIADKIFELIGTLPIDKRPK